MPLGHKVLVAHLARVHDGRAVQQLAQPDVLIGDLDVLIGDFDVPIGDLRAAHLVYLVQDSVALGQQRLVRFLIGVLAAHGGERADNADEYIRAIVHSGDSTRQRDVESEWGAAHLETPSRPL